MIIQPTGEEFYMYLQYIEWSIIGSVRYSIITLFMKNFVGKANY
jgi:hypothetical protein